MHRVGERGALEAVGVEADNDVPTGVWDVTVKLTGFPFSSSLFEPIEIVAVGSANIWTSSVVAALVPAESTTVHFAVKVPGSVYWCGLGVHPAGSPANLSGVVPSP